jgi:hypothetical protein
LVSSLADEIRREGVRGDGMIPRKRGGTRRRLPRRPLRDRLELLAFDVQLARHVLPTRGENGTVGAYLTAAA